MSISDAEYLAWLKGKKRNPVILCHFNYQYESAGAPATGTFYWSDKPYVDTVTPRPYHDVINSVPTYSRNLSGERLGEYSVSIGSLELDNADGGLDDILADAIDGSQVDFYYGDPAWAFTDFRLIFSALVVKASAPAFDRVSVQLKDTSVLLDRSIGGEVMIGGIGPNADKARPLLFGFINGMECLLSDSALLQYVWNDEPIGLFIDDTAASGFVATVYDRGVPVEYQNMGDGTFRLISTPDGGITSRVLYATGGIAGHHCVSDAFDYLIGVRCGLTAASLYDGAGLTYELRPEAPLINDFIDAGGQDYLIGLVISGARNVRDDLLRELCDTGLAFWAIKRTGEFHFGRIRPNDIAGLGVASSFSLVEDDWKNGTLGITHATPTYYQLQCESNRNWHPVTDPAGVLDLTPDARANVTRVGLITQQPDVIGTTFEAAPQLYDLTMQKSPELKNLLADSEPDDRARLRARNWLDTRRDTFLPWVETISGVHGIEFYTVELGDVGTITMPRFDCDSGALVQCIGIDINLSKAEVTLRNVRRHIPEDLTDPGEIIELGIPRTPYVYESSTRLCIDPRPVFTALGRLLEMGCAGATTMLRGTSSFIARTASKFTATGTGAASFDTGGATATVTMTMQAIDLSNVSPFGSGSGTHELDTQWSGFAGDPSSACVMVIISKVGGAACEITVPPIYWGEFDLMAPTENAYGDVSEWGATAVTGDVTNIRALDEAYDLDLTELDAGAPQAYPGVSNLGEGRILPRILLCAKTGPPRFVNPAHAGFKISFGPSTGAVRIIGFLTDAPGSALGDLPNPTLATRIGVEFNNDLQPSNNIGFTLPAPASFGLLSQKASDWYYDADGAGSAGDFANINTLYTGSINIDGSVGHAIAFTAKTSALNSYSVGPTGIGWSATASTSSPDGFPLGDVTINYNPLGSNVIQVVISGANAPYAGLTLNIDGIESGGVFAGSLDDIAPSITSSFQITFF